MSTPRPSVHYTVTQHGAVAKPCVTIRKTRDGVAVEVTAYGRTVFTAAAQAVAAYRSVMAAVKEEGA